MVKSKRIVLTKYFVGAPKESDFQLVEEELQPLKPGEVLCESLYFSVDPYMRSLSTKCGLGDTMIGSQVAKVIESEHDKFKVGSYIVGEFGWQTPFVFDGRSTKNLVLPEPYEIKDFDDLPLSLALGAIGMTGVTAYFGLLEICQPKIGDVVVVTGAGGAVGSHVGQIAKLYGCRVIGFTGSDDKVKWLKEELQFDEVFNYKNCDINGVLKEAAPDGVDCYFDNVGGAISSVILTHMKERGRVAVCGAISSYNADFSDLLLAPVIQPTVVFKQLSLEGFNTTRWFHCWESGIRQNLEWIKSGRLKYKETITVGFDKLPKAFIGMLKGENFGKAIVCV